LKTDRFGAIPSQEQRTPAQQWDLQSLLRAFDPRSAKWSLLFTPRFCAVFLSALLGHHFIYVRVGVIPPKIRIARRLVPTIKDHTDFLTVLDFGKRQHLVREQVSEGANLTHGIQLLGSKSTQNIAIAADIRHHIDQLVER
jgi:hypothetical protein